MNASHIYRCSTMLNDWMVLTCGEWSIVYDEAVKCEKVALGNDCVEIEINKGFVIINVHTWCLLMFNQPVLEDQPYIYKSNPFVQIN